MLKLNKFFQKMAGRTIKFVKIPKNLINYINDNFFLAWCYFSNFGEYLKII